MSSIMHFRKVKIPKGNQYINIIPVFYGGTPKAAVGLGYSIGQPCSS
jgi:hypothetical protein